MTEKDLKVNVKKIKAFCNCEKTVKIETFKFHAQFVEEFCEVTQFYLLNVTVGCIKNTL